MRLRVSAFETKVSRATASAVAGAERHGLDEADVPRTLERQRGEGSHVLVVVATRDHGVQLDRGQAGRLGRLDAGPDLRERAPAHHACEAVGIQGVEVDVHPPEPGGRQLVGQTRQEDAVGGHGEVPDPRDAGDPLDDLAEVGAQRRLATRQTELPEAHRHGGAHHRLDLLRRQQGLGGKKRNPSSGMQ